MKKEILRHSLPLLVFLVLMILLKRWFSLAYWPLIVGGLLGTILPDFDTLVYVFFLRPQELTSQRVAYFLARRQIGPALSLLYQTRAERTKLIFHTFYFQIIFWILAFLVVSSSGGVFGRGLVLAFALHLVVDQGIELFEIGNLDFWFREAGLVFEKEKYVFYWVGNLIVLSVFGFLL